MKSVKEMDAQERALARTNALKELKRIYDDYQSNSFDVNESKVIANFSAQLQILTEIDGDYAPDTASDPNAFEKIKHVKNALEEIKRSDKAAFVQSAADYFKEAISPVDTQEPTGTKFSSIFSKKADTISKEAFVRGVYSMAAEQAYKVLHTEHAYQPPKMPTNKK